MTPTTPAVRLGIFGPEESSTYEARGCSLWAPGYAAAVTAAGAVAVPLGGATGGRSWAQILDEVDGLVWTGRGHALPGATPEEERLCRHCKKVGLPLLAVDDGLHALNAAFGGTLHLHLPTERPEALQHRHPPEKGLRHAIMVEAGTHLADIYGEGEIVVNSEHSRGLSRVARGFRVSGLALDGVVEAIETEGDAWFAMGVQWRPASASASGLDIQLFRGLIDACLERQQAAPKRSRVACSAA